MKVYQSETRSVQVVVDVVCDLCGLSLYDKVMWPDCRGDDDENEVTIRHEKVYRDPWRVLGSAALTVDCCPACWTTRVLPFFRSIGLKCEYKDR